MVNVCFYFQVHQPYRIRKYTIFDIGKNQNYFDDKKNREIFQKVARKCYLPTNRLMLKLLKQHPEFRISYSLSGVFIDQCMEYGPEVLDSFRELVNTGQVEILSETYYHSLASLYSKEEFKRQVKSHLEKVKSVFGITPKVFRNTELIYNNELASVVKELGYAGMIAEGADHALDWRSPNFVYNSVGENKLPLLLKNYKLSDDIAFRFSDKGWPQWPLSVDTFVSWVNQINGNGHLANLFMDYETFGEHQWEDTGIFEFMEKLPGKILEHPDNGFVTPGQALSRFEPIAELNFPRTTSWADMERDLSAWRGNKMQDAALNRIYLLEKAIHETNDVKLIEQWRRLQTSDNFYYMCTKYFNDGDVHKYFSPYQTPYDAFINFMNVLNDVSIRVKETIDLNSSYVFGSNTAVNFSQ